MLRVSLLGERGLHGNGAGTIHYRKGWALLGYLAVEHGRRHPRSRLAELLWPRLAPAAARTNLRQVLADLNQALGPQGDALDAGPDSVGLFPPPRLRFDVHALDGLEAALASAAADDGAGLRGIEQDAACVGGAFLEGLELPGCNEFEAWLETTRRAIGKRTAATLQRVCGLQRVAGNLPGAIATMRRLVAGDPWNEGHVRLLMELLAEGGLHRQALEECDALQASLRRELDSELEPQTQALRLRIEADLRRGAPHDGGPAMRPRAARAGAEPAPATQRTVQMDVQEAGGEVVWIEIEHGGAPGTRLRLETAAVLIGRSRDADLCVAHNTVSRHHCTIWREGQGYRIRDLGATNRTRVNDAIVEEAELADGDRIVLGDAVLRFCRGEG
ncbi:MAG TPA: FHA domain-containing protein [Xanthomonadaceae bacterium]|nr:FHA domain-containing protein [Xanthomonadaceae bacterium]